MERIELLNTFVNNLTMMETVDEVNQYIEKQHPLHLMGVNADKINELTEKQKIEEDYL